MEIEYLTSSYSANQVEAIPKILRKKGYETAFFHGATNGSMNFDVFADVTGFEHYYGRTEYENEGDFDGTWGIFDEPFLDWSADQISAMKKPFFSTIFTISSHPPYTIPEQYKNRFNKGPSEMHDAVSYADYALSTFFEKAKKTDWYENTLFIIVADHTPASGTPVYFKDMGNMHIPLIFYHPTNPFFKGRSDKVVSQTDVMPTLLHLMGHKEPFFAFGQSVFEESDGFSASYIGDKFLYFGTYEDEHYMLLYQEEKCLGIFNLEDLLQTKNLKDNAPLKEALETALKAMIQTYNHALINNQMTTE
jgi:phosphoglycerol transferase MdoB-like AlkP superfamily enzyme